MEKSIEILRQDQVDYQPNASIRKLLGDISMIAVIGPVASGKSTIVRQVCEDNPDFKELVSFTTRDRRPGETGSDYRFLIHNNETLAALANKKQTGELVQYAVHPTTGHVYGTEISDYAVNDHNITPILSHSTEQLRKTGFGHYKEISVVSSVEDWQTYFESRENTLSQTEILSRLKQAEQSLKWSLSQEEMLWIVNSKDKIDECARSLVAIIQKGKYPSGKQGPKLAEQLLAHLQQLLQKRGV